MNPVTQITSNRFGSMPQIAGTRKVRPAQEQPVFASSSQSGRRNDAPSQQGFFRSIARNLLPFTFQTRRPESPSPESLYLGNDAIGMGNEYCPFCVYA